MVANEMYRTNECSTISNRLPSTQLSYQYYFHYNVSMVKIISVTSFKQRRMFDLPLRISSGSLLELYRFIKLIPSRRELLHYSKTIVSYPLNYPFFISHVCGTVSRYMRAYIYNPHIYSNTHTHPRNQTIGVPEVLNRGL